jgi:hypothetical protein
MKRRVLVVLAAALLTVGASLSGVSDAAPSKQTERSPYNGAPRVGTFHGVPVYAGDITGPADCPTCVLHGVHRDDYAKFDSGRVLRAWAAIEERPGGDVRFWLKTHAVGVHGTVVQAEYWLNSAWLVWQVCNPQCQVFNYRKCSPANPCYRRGLDVFFLGAEWRDKCPSCDESAWTTLGDLLKGHILNTNDTSNWHCVSSYKWFVDLHTESPRC